MDDIHNMFQKQLPHARDDELDSIIESFLRYPGNNCSILKDDKGFAIAITLQTRVQCEIYNQYPEILMVQINFFIMYIIMIIISQHSLD
jgi:hypothetical protein